MKRRPKTSSYERLSAVERERQSNRNWRMAKDPMFKSTIPRFLDDHNGIPGPGNYKPELDKGKAMSFKSSAARKFILGTHNVQSFVPVASPSPIDADYDKERALVALQRRSPTPMLPKVSRWAHKKKEIEAALDSVGPGHYTLPTPKAFDVSHTFSRLPRFTKCVGKKKGKLVKVRATKFPDCREINADKYPNCLGCNPAEKIKTARDRGPGMFDSSYMDMANNKNDLTRAVFRSTRVGRNPYVRMEHIHYRDKTADGFMRQKQAWNTLRVGSAKKDYEFRN